MSDFDALIVRGHQKIVEHWRRLHDTAASEDERRRFQKYMEQEQDSLRRYLAKRLASMKRHAA